MIAKHKKQFKPPRVVRRRRKAQPETLWAKQYLEERDVPIEFAEQNGVQLCEEYIVFEKRHPLSGALLTSSRTRHKVPPLDPKTGKPMKFTQKRGQSAPYFPKHWNWNHVFETPSIDIFIVESECSALSAARHGWAAIAVGGCDGVFMSGTHRQKLHPIFSEIKLKGRRVYIVFDADSKNNSNVHAAEQAAAKLFAEAVR
jgi:hypothetical protein